MEEIKVYDQDGQQITMLVQWDLDVYIYIKDDRITTNHNVHFFNSESDVAYVVSSTYEDGILCCKIPNRLLFVALPITGYIYTTEDDDTYRSTYVFSILIRSRVIPSDFMYIPDAMDDYISAVKVLAWCEDYAKSACQCAADAEDWATISKSWAVGDTGARDGEDTDNSKYYCQEAATSASNAATSEKNAATSASNAATSEKNAKTSETNAAASAAEAAKFDGSLYALREYYANDSMNVGRASGTDVGTRSFVLGYNCEATNSYSHAEGRDTRAYGQYSHAEGYDTQASGNYSHVESRKTLAYANYSHAEGYDTQVGDEEDNTVGQYAHAEGNGTIATGSASHAEGRSTTASGSHAHSEGYKTNADGYYSHAEGYSTKAFSDYSHAEGGSTTAGGEDGSGDYSHAEGRSTTASGTHSHAEGRSTTANNDCSHAEGYDTAAEGKYSHAEGHSTNASQESSHAEGSSTTASGDYSHAEGYYSQATGSYSHAEGGRWLASDGVYHNLQAAGDYSHAEGAASQSTGSYSHAEGCMGTSKAECSHVEGYGATASGSYSHAGGYSCTAGGNSSFASGYSCAASNSFCFAVGNNTSASGSGASAFGVGTRATGSSQTVVGQYNSTSSSAFFIVGNGSSNSSSNANAFRVDYTGDAYTYRLNASGADYAEYVKEWADGNTDEEDRVGYFVTIKNGLLYKANEGDYIIGITSGNPSVIGNADEDYYWKYERDDFGRIIYIDAEDNGTDGQDTCNDTNSEESGISESLDVENTESTNTHMVMVLSEDYDSSLQDTYVERKDRPEWDYVGMVGVIPVRDDGTCKVDEFCKCGDGGIATYAEERGFDTYYVIERVSDNVVSVVMR